jgi:hypothetical protein
LALRCVLIWIPFPELRRPLQQSLLSLACSSRSLRLSHHCPELHYTFLETAANQIKSNQIKSNQYPNPIVASLDQYTAHNMPGTSSIGDNKLGPESLPPEARVVNRHFRLLKEPDAIRESILDVLDRAPPSCRQVAQIRQLFELSFRRLKNFEHRNDRMFEQKLAKALNAAIENAFIDADEDDLDSFMGSPVAKIPAANSDDSDSDESIVAPAPHKSPGSSRTSLRRTSRSFKAAPPSSATNQDVASIALVSEADQASDEPASSDAPRSAKAFWGMLLEAMTLQVASRTTQVWGRKKIYEVYRLNGPVTTTKTPEDIRRAVHDEFGSMFKNCVDYRTYALERQSDGYLCIFLKIGKYYDYHDERNRAISGEKKKKKADEFIVIVKPDSSLMAVTASRASSRAKNTKFLLPALDFALSTVDKNVSRSGEWRMAYALKHTCVFTLYLTFVLLAPITQLSTNHQLALETTKAQSLWNCCMQLKRRTLVRLLADSPPLPPTTQLKIP